MANLSDILGSPQFYSAIGQFASAMDPNPNGFARRAGAAGYDNAQAAIIQKALQDQKKEKEKEKKAGTWKKIGSALGSVAGTVLSGGNPAVGAAIGSAIGGQAGSVMGGGELSLADALSDGASTFIGSSIAPSILSNIAGSNGPLSGAAQGLLDIPSRLQDFGLSAGLAQGLGNLANTSAINWLSGNISPLLLMGMSGLGGQKAATTPAVGGQYQGPEARALMPQTGAPATMPSSTPGATSAYRLPRLRDTLKEKNTLSSALAF